jgi:hypothetical protein
MRGIGRPSKIPAPQVTMKRVTGWMAALDADGTSSAGFNAAMQRGDDQAEP